MAAKKKNEELKLTKYELARMIGSRALQISHGAPFMVKLSKKQLEEISYNPIEIAKLEMAEEVIPMNIVRTNPHREHVLKQQEEAKASE